MLGAEVAHGFAWHPAGAHILGMETHLWPPVIFPVISTRGTLKAFLRVLRAVV